ncbi:uncharacterized protein [Watersipora subatra]|uniref:uncharacterized protein n=1 Tax=Watersipora subatra TaxID=2589382 RepID=UPI00355C8D65
MNASEELSRKKEDLDCGLEIGLCDGIRKVQTGISSVSIIALLVTLCFIFLFQKYRLFYQKIVCYLLLSTLMETISRTMGTGKLEAAGTGGCRAQGFFLQFFSFAALMWMSILTVFVFCIMVKRKDTTKHAGLYTALAWSIPSIVACIPMFTDDYDVTWAAYCWIAPSPVGHAYRIVLYYIPVIGAASGMALTFFYIVYKTQKSEGSYRVDEKKAKSKDVKRYLYPLAGYASAYFLLKLALFINRLSQISSETTYGLLMFHTVVSGLWGTFMSALFFLTTDRSKITVSNLKKGVKYHTRQLSRIIRFRQKTKTVSLEIVTCDTTETPRNTMPRRNNEAYQNEGDNEAYQNEDDNEAYQYEDDNDAYQYEDDDDAYQYEDDNDAYQNEDDIVVHSNDQASNV